MNEIRQWKNNQIGVLPYPGQLNTGWHGLFILVNDEKHLNPEEESLVSALHSAQLPFKFQQKSPSDNRLAIMLVASR